jgi:hypothetical protein
LEKVTRNAPSRDSSKTITNKMFEEIVGTQLITELKGKKNGAAEPALKRWTGALYDTSEQL